MSGSFWSSDLDFSLHHMNFFYWCWLLMKQKKHPPRTARQHFKNVKVSKKKALRPFPSLQTVHEPASPLQHWRRFRTVSTSGKSVINSDRLPATTRPPTEESASLKRHEYTEFIPPDPTSGRRHAISLGRVPPRSLSSCLTQRVRVTPTHRGVSTWYPGLFDVVVIPTAISASRPRKKTNSDKKGKKKRKVKHDNCGSARLRVCWNLAVRPKTQRWDGKQENN